MVSDRKKASIYTCLNIKPYYLPSAVQTVSSTPPVSVLQTHYCRTHCVGGHSVKSGDYFSCWSLFHCVLHCTLAAEPSPVKYTFFGRFSSFTLVPIYLDDIAYLSRTEWTSQESSSPHPLCPPDVQLVA